MKSRMPPTRPAPQPEAASGPIGVRVTASVSDPDRDPRREIPEVGFRDYWYPVVAAKRVPRRKPLRVQLLGDVLCVFRGASGIAVISDVCPHRGASLSGGRCYFHGTVSCPYHGWTYDEMGACVAALSEGPESRIPGRVHTHRYPSVTLHGVVFAWMGGLAPVPPERDLPPELFDGSYIQNDATIWKANWRPALENLNDNHVFYVHRNSIQVLMQPLAKMRFRGARPVIKGGGVSLSLYADGTAASAPYQQEFPAVGGRWPRTRYRLMWTWLFRLRPLSWLWRLGQPGYPVANRYHDSDEWNMGPHMPGMQRISGGTTLYTRWCVPIDATSTREFYLWATRPANRVARMWERAKYPITQRLLRNRNLGFQDGRVLGATRFDAPERFTEFDIETIGWRRLAILSARHGGRHDRIPQEVIDRLNRSALTDDMKAEGS